MMSSVGKTRRVSRVLPTTRALYTHNIRHSLYHHMSQVVDGIDLNSKHVRHARAVATLMFSFPAQARFSPRVDTKSGRIDDNFRYAHQVYFADSF